MLRSDKLVFLATAIIGWNAEDVSTSSSILQVLANHSTARILDEYDWSSENSIPRSDTT